jgi:hypothetical protein
MGLWKGLPGETPIDFYTMNQSCGGPKMPSGDVREQDNRREIREF